MTTDSTQITIQLPDGSSREYAAGTTLLEIAKSLHSSLAKKSYAAVVNGEIRDLGRSLEEDGEVRFVGAGDPESLEVVRHSCAHLMAQAIKRVFPEAEFGVGPVIENGFYYDLEISRPLTPEDLQAIDKEMRKAIKRLQDRAQREAARGSDRLGGRAARQVQGRADP